MIAALILAAAATTTSAAPAPDAPAVPAALDRWLADSGFQGNALVVRGNLVLLRKGYGAADRERDVPYSPETVFSIGSITKQFTAAAILKLEMQGQLRVEDPIARYLPGVPADKQSITVHHLLTHTAGLDSDFAGDYDPVGRDEYVRRVLAAPLRGRPGEAYFYANSGYSLLGAIVEIVSGTGYENYLREHLFLPAGMKDTGYRLAAWEPRRLAVGYGPEGRWGRITERPWAEDGPYWALRANGGIHSTLDDLLRWDRALRGDAILSPAAKDKMYARHVAEGPGSGSFYGYGWSIQDAPGAGLLVAHNGGNRIFYADFLRFLDRDLVVIVSTNDAAVRGGRAAEALARIALGERVPVAPPAGAAARPLGTSPRETVVRAWFEAFNAEGFEAMRAFRAAHAVPRPGTDDAERDERLQRMRQDLGRLEPEGVLSAAGEEVVVRARSTRGPGATLRFMFEAGDRLGGIVILLIGLELQVLMRP